MVSKLRVLNEIGLGYLRLGQSATTLSGGEAQRLKLAAHLTRSENQGVLYILDEPTTGLHFDDIAKLLAAFRRLLESGASLLVIEHNLDVIKSADWLIDLGPEGGDQGGNIIATGTPEQVARNPQSHTGRYLAKVLANGNGKGKRPANESTCPTVSPTCVESRNKLAGAVMGICDHHWSPFFASVVFFLSPATPGGKSTSRRIHNRSSQGKPQKVRNPLNDLLDEAQAALDKNDFAAAVTPLQKFLAEKPDVAYAHFQLAYAYTGLHQTDEAHAEYQKSIALDSKMAEAHLNLGILHLEKDPAAAAISLRKAVEFLPSQSRPRFLFGLALERSGDLPGRGSVCGGHSLDPNDTESLVHLGEIDLQLKKPADAEKKFRLVLSRDPKSPPALRGLALSLDAQNKPDAVDAYRNYLAVAPQDAEVRTRFVHLLVANKQFDEALAVSEKTASSQPPTLDDLNLRADIQIGQNKLDDAMKTLQLAITLAPRDAQLHGGLGRLYLQKREFPDAERELKIAIQLDRQNVIYWKDLASTFYLAGNYAAALAGYDVVDKFEHPGAGEWFIRALCYDKLDQVQAALDAYHKFLDLDHNQHSDQVWQANQRIHVLEKRAEKKK